MNYDFDNVAQRDKTPCIKWNKDKIKNFCGNENATPYWVADMEYKAAPEISKAAKEVVNFETYGYTSYCDIKEIFINFVKNRHNLTVKESQISIGQGVLNAIATMLYLNCKKGDGVIIPFPSYKPFIDITKNLDLEVLPWKLKRTEDSCDLDFSLFDDLCKRAKVLILCSPHNPSGKVYPKETLEMICDIANKHDVFVISDEIHADLVFKDQKFYSFIDIAKEKNTKTMVAMAPSKTFNIAGEFFSVSLFNDLELKKKFDTFRSNLHYSSSPYFSTTVAREAYDKCLPWLLETVEVLENNTRYIESFMAKNVPNIKVLKAQASFVCFWDCTSLMPLVERDAKDNKDLYNLETASEAGLLSLFFGQRAGICLNDGSWFGGEDYKGYVRFNFATNLESIKDALLKVEKAVNELEKKYNN